MTFNDNGTGDVFRRLNRAVRRGKDGQEIALAALESRLLYSAGDGHDDDDLHTDFPAMVDPVAIQETVDAQAGAVGMANVPVSGGVPVFNSNPGAPARLIIDFDGAAAMSWGSYSVPQTPAYDQDGDPTTFNAAELASINEIVLRVAEKFSPFNVNVTTVDDGGPYLNKQALRIVVGGTGAWVGAVTGGVAYIGGFYNTSDNTGFAFSGNLSNGYAKYTAEAVAHEAGHAFGLQHQSVWNGSTLGQEYNPGTSATAPVMGVSYYATRGLWWTGTPSTSSSATQYDLTTLTNSNNGFGFRADDHGDSRLAATSVAVSDNKFTTSGVITQNTDADFFSFTMGSGTVTLTLGVAQYGAMLDGSLFVYDSQGNMMGSRDTSGLGETLSLDLPAGTYTVSVVSKGGYGDIGQYTLAGSIVPGEGVITVATPGSFAATPVSGMARVTVSWSDQSNNESGFLIERSMDGVTWSTLTMLGANVTSYQDDSVTASTTYYYRVQAYNAYATSAFTSAVTALTVPAGPTGAGATPNSATQATITWAAVSGATAGYVIERSTNGTTWGQVGTSGTTSYTDTGLAGGTQYYYRVRAANASGNSAASSTVTALTLPAAPSGVVGTAASAAQIGLTWTAVTGASSYQVERSLDGSTWAAIGTSLTASYTDTSLSAATTYHYRVRAVNASGNSAYSSTATALTRPAAPTIQTVTATSATAIAVTWSAVSGAASYQVDRSLNGSTWTQVGTPSGATFSDTGLTAGTRYYYRIRAINASGTSTNSATLNTFTMPAAPASFTASVVSTTQVNLSWSAVTGATSYTVERSADGNTWSSLTASTASTTFNDTTVTAGTAYTYRVRANNTSGGSGYTVASALTLPAAPGSLAASVTATQVTLSWGSVTGAASYVVERSPNGSTWTQVGTPAGTTFVDTGLSSGTQYSYRVRAVNATGGSAYSSTYTALTLPAAPGTPTVTATSMSAVTVSWSAVTGAASYAVERSTNGTTWAAVTTTSGTSFGDSGLTPGTQYYYRVRATNASGNSAYSAAGSGVTLSTAPAGLAASVTATQVTLTWGSVAGATVYAVERSANGTTWAALGTSAAPSYTDSGLTASTHYYYRVRAGNGSGYSAYSATFDALTAPVAPTGTTATPVSATRVDVAWSAVTGATSYAVERSVNGTTWVQVGTSTGTSYSDTTATAGTQFQYRVRASNAGGLGAYGASASALTLPAAPSAVNVTQTSGTSVLVTWSAVASANSYQVERSIDGTTWATIGIAAGTTLGDSGLADGMTYYFRVRATNASGASGYTTGTNATVAPAAPGSLSVSSVSTTSVGLAWQPSSGATGYVVERSLDGSNWSVLTTTAIGVTTATDTGLSTGTGYQYRVKASNQVGNSAASETLATITLPAAPVVSSVNAAVAGQVSITWAGVTGAASYTLERSTNGTTWSTVAITAGTSHTDSTVAAGTQFIYRVRATNASGNSNYGTSTAALTLPAVPGGLSATPISTTRVDVSWAGVTGATSYRVERSANGTTWTVVGTVATTSLSDTGAAAGSAYTYRVAAINATGASANSVTASALTVPNAPGSFAAALSDPTTITLTWTATTGATTYVVERSTGGNWSVVATLGQPGFVDGDLTPGVTYAYRVRAGNATGPSAYTATASATPPIIMTAPTLDAVGDATSSSVTVSWQDNSDNEHGFLVQRSADGGETWSTVAQTAANVTTHVDTSAAGGTTYTYRVRAFALQFLSDTSATASATTTPAAPTGVVVATVSVSRLAVSWQAVVGAVSYELERSADGVDEWETIATLEADETTYTDVQLPGGTRQHYRVRAVSEVGESPYSAVTTNVTLPAAPSYVTAVAMPEGPVAVALAETVGALMYLIERSADGVNWSQLLTSSDLFFIDASAAGGTTYHYRAVALGEAGPSGAVMSQAVLTYPAAPSDPYALTLEPGQVNVSWMPVEGASSFLIERSSDGVTWETIGTSSLNSYTDAGLLPNARFFYRARAVNATGTSPASEAIEATTLQTRPDAPSALAVSQVSSDTVRLAWQSMATNEVGFRVEYSRNGGKSWLLAGNLPAKASSVQITGLVTGDNYRFRVAAYNEMGMSGNSNAASGRAIGAKPGTQPGSRVLDVENVKTAMPGLTKKLAPDAVSAVRARAYSPTAVQLTWNDRSDNELGFRVEYSLDGKSWQLAGNTAANQTGARLTNLQKGKAYLFRVTAYNFAADAKPVTARATTPVKPLSGAKGKPSVEPDQDTVLNVLNPKKEFRRAFRIDRAA